MKCLLSMYLYKSKTHKRTHFRSSLWYHLLPQKPVHTDFFNPACKVTFKSTLFSLRLMTTTGKFVSFDFIRSWLRLHSFPLVTRKNFQQFQRNRCSHRLDFRACQLLIKLSKDMNILNSFCENLFNRTLWETKLRGIFVAMFFFTQFTLFAYKLLVIVVENFLNTIG